MKKLFCSDRYGNIETVNSEGHSRINGKSQPICSKMPLSGRGIRQVPDRCMATYYYEAWLIRRNVDASMKIFVATGMLVLDLGLFIGERYHGAHACGLSSSLQWSDVRVTSTPGTAMAASGLFSSLNCYAPSAMIACVC